MADKKTKTGKQKEVRWKDTVLEKTAVSSRDQSFTITMRSLRELAEKESQLVQCSIKDMENNLVDPNFILELTKTIHGSGEKSISDYVLRNKEILLNEHSSVVRRQVIQSMNKQLIDMNQEALKGAEKLEEDVVNFMELIGNSQRQASDSFQRVCQIAEENKEKAELVKKTQDELFVLKTEVEKSEQVLIEYLMCTAFLESISPPENINKNTFVFPKGFLKGFRKISDETDDSSGKLTPQDVLEQLLESGENFDPVQVPFKSPDQVIKIIESLKDRNLALIHNSRLSKGSTKDEMSTITESKQKMEDELKIWDDQIAIAENEVLTARENSEKLNGLVRKLNEEDLDKEEKARKQKQMDKIIEIYRLCTGSDAKHIDLTLMRATIDSFLEDLMQKMNKYPRKTIKRIMKRLEAEKKQSERKASEALRAQRMNERLQKEALSLKSPRKAKKTQMKKQMK